MKVGTELQAGRFRVLALVGEGAMGRVYRAWDASLERDVALKTFRRPAPDELYRLKHEFRSLAGFSHPHMVRLYELFSDADDSFFTMEMIEGEPLLDYVRGRAAPGAALDDASFERLRRTFRQLVSGLHALHEAGQVHRDVKPSNVLVNADGHAILVDFGLATLGRYGADSEDGGFRGTFAYAAPEQIWGQPATPAVDRYAVGVSLFEALTGRLPFEGSADRILRAKELEAPRPSVYAAGVPVALDELAHRLMARDPAHRPGDAEILDALVAPSEVKPASAPEPAGAVGPFVGRDEALTRLAAALQRSRSRPGVVYVRGSSGIGKTEVVLRFAESQRRKAPLVLRGRCRHQESVAYRALDPLVDDLSRLLVQLPEAVAASLVPRFADALIRLFPVLARVSPLSHAPSTGAASDEELLRRGFDALRELLARIADQWSLILWIDDAQWGDRGSIALLRSLLRPPDAPRLLLILSYRVEDEASVLVSALRGEGFGLEVDEETISLDPLDEGECRQLLEQLASSKISLSERQREAIVDESAGSPFFLHELFRHAVRRGGVDAEHSIERVLDERLRPLSKDARAVLDLVAVAGRPVAERFVLDVAGVGAAGRPLVLDLCAQSLLRTSGREGAGEIETYHDRIRELVLDSLAEEDRRRRHRQIADGLRAQVHPDPRALVEHYLGAEENALAAEYAERAARDAADELAFDRSADLYALAIRLRGKPDGDHELELRRAEALANAGRGAEAGDAYIAAAEALGRTSPDRDRQTRLIGFAAEHYLYAGHWRVGLDRTREVMRHHRIRIPATSREAMRRANLLRLRSFLLQKHRRFRRRPVPPTTRDLLAALFGTSKGTALVLPKLSDFLGMLYLSEALAAGDPEHAAIALAKEASIEGALPGPRWRRRGAQLITAARRIAGESAEPHVRGTILTCQGALHYFSAEWERAVQVCEQAVNVFRNECIGQSQSVSITMNFLIPALAQSGNLDRMRRLVPEFLEDARRRGDPTASRVLLAGEAALVTLARDDPKDAIDNAQRLIELVSSEGDLANPYHIYLATWWADLYAGRVASAWRRTAETWERLVHLGFTTFEMYAVLIRNARAATALACAAHGGLPDASPEELERLATRDARWLERSKLANAAPLAASLRASLAALHGDAAAQRTALERARSGFEQADMPLHAHACTLHLAELGAADAGPALKWMEERQILDPRSMARAIVPGAWS